MSEARQIVFVKFARFSFSNDRIERFLRESFPEFELHTIDVAEYLKKHLAVTAMGVLGTCLRQGTRLLDGRTTLRAGLIGAGWARG